MTEILVRERIAGFCRAEYFPSHSPELNPEKRLNCDLKQVIGAKVPAHTRAKLKSAAIEHIPNSKTNLLGLSPTSRTHASSMPLDNDSYFTGPDQ